MLLKNQQQRISEVARKAFTTPRAAYPRLLLPYTLCAYCISLSSFSLLHPNFMMIYFTDGQEQQLSLIQRIIEMLQYIYSRWNMRRNAFTRNDRGGCSNISATTYHLHSKACTYISKYANLAKYEKNCTIRFARRSYVRSKVRGQQMTRVSHIVTLLQ